MIFQGFGNVILHFNLFNHEHLFTFYSFADLILADETLRFDGENVPQERHSRNTTLILLVTYLRSGSTWLGEITKQAKNSFYTFEPFQAFIKQGYYANDSVCFNNDTCR